MSQKALSMRKIKEVLRLRYDLGLLQNEIARSCSIGQASVHRYLERASAAGLSWPLPEDWDDRRLNELLFPAAPAGGSPSVRGPVDFAVIHHQLQSNKYVTLQLLWEEYRQSQPEGYRYSRFCELYRRWHRKQDVTVHNSIWYDGAIMMSRTQITLDHEMQRRVRRRASDLGVSLAEYFRRLVARDLARPEAASDVHLIFDLGDSGGSDIARDKDEMIGEAVHSSRKKRP
jgi:hypothetical protein